MRVEDVVESLNDYIREVRLKKNITRGSFLVLKKSVLPNETFKAYKDFNYEIYVVTGRDSYKVITLNLRNRATTDAEIEYLKEQCERQLVTKLFEWSHSYEFEQIINDNYENL